MRLRVWKHFAENLFQEGAGLAVPFSKGVIIRRSPQKGSDMSDMHWRGSLKIATSALCFYVVWGMITELT